MSNYVLIVDDEPAVRDLIAKVLTQHGYACATCENGRAALRHLESEPLPALILLDLKMPGLNGWKVGDRLKSHPQWQEIPVAVLSSEPRGRMSFQQVAYLGKPIDWGLLLAVATEYCAAE